LAANPRDFGEVVIAAGLGALAGGAGSAAPDQIEPAVHPNHRKTAHSMTVGAGVSYATLKAVSTGLDRPFDDFQTRMARAVAAAYGAGYASHLVLDGATPKGLPLI